MYKLKPEQIGQKSGSSDDLHSPSEGKPLTFRVSTACLLTNPAHPDYSPFHPSLNSLSKYPQSVQISLPIPRFIAPSTYFPSIPTHSFNQSRSNSLFSASPSSQYHSLSEYPHEIGMGCKGLLVSVTERQTAHNIGQGERTMGERDEHRVPAWKTITMSDWWNRNATESLQDAQKKTKIIEGLFYKKTRQWRKILMRFLILQWNPRQNCSSFTYRFQV